jgi:photosystem II stability/assembly factor-like uncharacterized protein
MTEIIYVGADEGLFRLSREAGGSWTTTKARMPRWSVTAIEVSPTAPEVVYIGTVGNGVWRSEDAGLSLVKPSYGRVGPGKVRSVTVDPHSASRIWVGGEPIQLFVSDDEAATWTTVTSVQDHPWVPQVPFPVHEIEPHVRDVVVDPLDENVLYVALQVGHIFKSTDAGKTWNLLREGMDCDVHMIYVDPRDTSRVLAIAGGLSEGRGLFGSRDGGETWTPLAMNFAQDYGVALAVRPDNPAVIYTSLATGHSGHWPGRPGGAESAHIRTADGGETWEEIDLSAIANASRQLVLAYSFDPGAPDRLYAALSGGEIVVTDDAGDTWSTTGAQFAGVKDIRCVRT